MTKKKIILLGVVSFLLIVIFLPRQIDTYHQDGRITEDKYYGPKDIVLSMLRIDPNGQSGYYTVPRIYFSIFSYMSEEHELGRQSGSFILPALIIGEKQSLREPHELTHDERFDILNSASCEIVIQQNLSTCRQHIGKPGYSVGEPCIPYLQGPRYDYCMFVYDETSFSDGECKMLQYRYFQYWWVERDKRIGGYLDYDRFAEYFCKKDPLG